MSVSAAAGLLAAAGADTAPVVDSGGRCVGLFTAAGYRRWLTGAAPVIDVFSEGQMVAASDRVGDHMTRCFATAAAEAGVPELLQRLGSGADPFLVVLDRQGRPVGLVCGLDALVAEASRAAPGPAAGGHALFLES
jgi:CBS-domain-containing membrane protein